MILAARRALAEPRSLRFRFTLLTAVIVTLVVMVVGVVFSLIFTARLRSDLDTELRTRVTRINHAVAGRTTPFAQRGGGAFLPRGGEAANVFTIAHTADGAQAALSPNVSENTVVVDEATWRSAGASSPTVVTAGGSGQRFSVALVRLDTPISFDDPSGVTRTVDAIAVGESLAGIDATEALLRDVLLLAGLLGVALAAGGGWLVSRRAVRPIAGLVAAVSAVGAAADPSLRVSVPRAGDEIRSLAVAFNQSLERLEAAYRSLEALLARQQQLVADASHELRTPLTTVRTDIEVLRKHRALPEEQQVAKLDSSIAELERLSRLVGDLLTLARADTATAVRPSTVDWESVLTAAVDDARRVVEPRTLHAEITALGQGVADADAVARAVAAVVENVAHHTGEDRSVWMRAVRNNGSVTIAVEDDGQGVPDATLEHLFDRFFQADQSRHTEGTGLGLAIARSIAEAHGGTVEAARSHHGGLAVSLVLPAGGDPA